MKINLWLDDAREAPEGWVHVKSVEEAKPYFAQGLVEHSSLDHDLGACEDCLDGGDAEDWMSRTKYAEMPNCEHVGTGYTLVCWLAETGHWPETRPVVHSANAAGRARMEAAIKRCYGR